MKHTPFATPLIFLFCILIAACSGGSSPHPSARSSGKALSDSALFHALGCQGPRAGAPVTDVPGATSYSCVGTTQALATWSSAEIDFQNGITSTDPGQAPLYSVLVTFTSAGARDVYEQQDAAAAQSRGAETDPVLKRVDAMEAQLPDIVGPNWIVWGNDPSTAIAAHNLLAGTQPVASSQTTPTPTNTGPASSSSVNAALTCTITPDGSSYTIDPGTSGYSGQAQVTLTMRSRGITFPDQPVVAVAPPGSPGNTHPIPIDDSGASAIPDSCTASPA